MLGVGALGRGLVLEDRHREQPAGEQHDDREQRPEQHADARRAAGDHATSPRADSQPARSSGASDGPTSARAAARLQRELPLGLRVAAVADDVKALVEQRLDGRGERLRALLGRGRAGERAGGDRHLRERQPAELGERRAGGPEAVDGEAEAAHAQPREDVERRRRGRRAARVGQRDADARELDAGLRGKLGEAVDDLGAGERRGRQDERDVDELAGVGELALRGEAGARDELGDGRGGLAGQRRPVAGGPAEHRARLDRAEPPGRELDAGAQAHGDALLAQRRGPRIVARRGRLGRGARCRAVQPDGLQQPARRQRLADRAEHLQAVAARGRLGRAQDAVVEAARDDDRRAAVQLGDVAQELDTVHAGHVEVADDDVRARVGAEQRERALAVGGLEQLARAEVREDLQRRAALELVVLDDHHRAVGQRHVRTPFENGSSRHPPGPARDRARRPPRASRRRASRRARGCGS